MGHLHGELLVITRGYFGNGSSWAPCRELWPETQGPRCRSPLSAMQGGWHQTHRLGSFQHQRIQVDGMHQGLEKGYLWENSWSEAREKWWFMVGSISDPENDGEWCFVTH